MINKLLKNPEKYKIKEFRATNKVYLAEIEGQKYVVKSPSWYSDIAYCYYMQYNRLLWGMQKFAKSKTRFWNEIKKLTMLKEYGCSVPWLIAYDGKTNTTILEYMGEENCRDVLRKSDANFTDKFRVIENAFISLNEIHNTSTIHGDPVIKNANKVDNRVYWYDFETIIDESDQTKAKACDLLKFVFSIYTVSRDEKLAECTSILVKLAYTDKAVLNKLEEMVSINYSGLRMWLPTRMPFRLSKKLNDLLVKTQNLTSREVSQRELLKH